MKPFLYSENKTLLCPVCGGDRVHVDDVFVAGRAQEDADIIPIAVNSAGQVAGIPVTNLPTPDLGRSHVICLKGWCESCSNSFVFEFKHHKGQTFLAIRKSSWMSIEPFKPPEEMT